jgi:hypothetical protein
MKNYYLSSMITACLLILSNGIKAQNANAKLNQVDLIKQFVSNWKGEVGKDTTAFWNIKSSGDGLECTFKYVTIDKIFMEGTQQWKYDKKTDKFILSSPNSGMDNTTSGLWFTSRNLCLIISDIDNPEKATYKIETEFKSPDTFIQKTMVNGSIVKTVTYNRVKN